MSQNHPFPAKSLRVIHLRGSDREMGQQHAAQLGASCLAGMPKFYHDLIGRMLGASGDTISRRLLFGAVRKLVDPVLVDRLLRQVPRGSLDRVEGLCEVSGLNLRELQIALVLPDLLPIAQALMVKGFPKRFVPALPEARFGCSSFVAKGDRFLVGRNLDFPGVSFWDRYPVIQNTIPESGLRYISFTTAGVPIGGITGINEAQVYVGIHQHYCKTFSLNGQLPFVVAQRVLGQARTSDEALNLLRQSQLGSGWAFVVADGKSKQGFVFEATPKGHGVRPLTGDQSVLVHSNYYQTATCQRFEFSNSARMNWDNHARKSRLESVVRAAGPGLTPRQACLALSDHVDPYWGEEKILNRTVSQAYNIQSLVLDPENMTAWMAVGDSPIHLRDYAAVSLGEVFAGRDGIQKEMLMGFRFDDPAKTRAKESFVLALVHAMNAQDGLSAKMLDQSLESHFSPEVAQVDAVVSMKSGLRARARSRLEKAIEQMDGALARYPHPKAPPEYFEVLLFLARLEDLEGNLTQSRGIYRRISDAKDLEDTHIRRIAQRAKRFRPQDLDRLILPFSTYVPFV